MSKKEYRYVIIPALAFHGSGYAGLIGEPFSAAAEPDTYDDLIEEYERIIAEESYHLTLFQKIRMLPYYIGRFIEGVTR